MMRKSAEITRKTLNMTKNQSVRPLICQNSPKNNPFYANNALKKQTTG